MRGWTVLTDTKIRNAKPRDRRYRLSDGHGLSIEISPTGKRYWRYRYRIGGKENIFAAGEWCHAPSDEAPDDAAARQESGDLTLAEARAARAVWRRQVRVGQHPRLVRLANRLVASRTAANSFEAVAREFIEHRGGGWGGSYRRHFASFLENDVFPEIGPLPIASLRAAHILAVLQKVEARGALSRANEGRGYLGQIFRYAVATQKTELDPLPALRGALAKADTKHHPILNKADIRPFLHAISRARPNRETEIAVWLLLFTMTRTVEMRTGWWQEMDIKAAEWRIGAERMKIRRPHIVPLSRQAVQLVEELQTLTGNAKLLFPNARRRDRPMNPSTLNRVFERAGYKGVLSPHGFRGTASTILREAGFDDRLVELQLAHVDRNKSRAAYDHSQMLGARRIMLQEWADIVEAALSPRRAL